MKEVVVATLQMEGKYSSGASVHFQRTTRRYTSEVITLQVKSSVKVNIPESDKTLVSMLSVQRVNLRLKILENAV
jgi:hypothetical protein